jgi:hypothetical protein
VWSLGIVMDQPGVSIHLKCFHRFINLPSESDAEALLDLPYVTIIGII